MREVYTLEVHVLDPKTGATRKLDGERFTAESDEQAQSHARLSLNQVQEDENCVSVVFTIVGMELW